MNSNNFRDVSALTNVRSGVFYRSGNALRRPEVLAGEKPIRRVLDLRSGEEHESNDAWLTVAPSLTIRTYSSADGIIDEERIGVLLEGTAGTAGTEGKELVIHRVSLLDKGKFVRRLIWQLPLIKTLQALGYKLIGNDAGMRDVLIPVVNDLGLSLVYTTILDTSQRELLACLEFLLECLRGEESLLVMCAIGKDRTGLFTAIVLACCDVPLVDILDDYCLSNGIGEVALAGVERMESLRGINRDLFSDAPRDAMEGAFRFLEERYGGVDNYLDAIGFGFHQQAELRQRMTVQIAQKEG